MNKIYFFIISALTVLTACGGAHSYKNTIKADVTPKIWPDYKDVTIPFEIAPMNFNFVGDEYNWLVLKIVGSNGDEISCEGKYIDIDIDSWHNLTIKNKGGYLDFYLSVIVKDDKFEFQPFKMYVSDEPLNQFGLTYRLVKPGYIGYSKMGIYQRNIANFDEDAIYETTCRTNTCVNCHTPNKTNSDYVTFHVRGEGGFTLIKDGDDYKAYNLKTDKTISAGVYPYWHPTGRYIAYSNNKTFQVFHTAHKNKIEVFDENSDVIIYDVENHEVIISPQLQVDSIAETFPAFSPDGNTLYFCKSNKMKPPMYLEDIHYCIMQVPFDFESGKVVGEPDTLLAIPNKSLTLPRPSYDGKFLMFTMANFGTFPIWHHEADLYMIDLEKSSKDTTYYYETLGLNSSDTESFHNWSANSKWTVVSSRREDGLYTRLYISQLTDSATFTKPFILPQRNPLKYYRELFYSYNTPDFCDKPFNISPAALRGIVNSEKRENVKVR